MIKHTMVAASIAMVVGCSGGSGGGSSAPDPSLHDQWIDSKLNDNAYIKLVVGDSFTVFETTFGEEDVILCRDGSVSYSFNNHSGACSHHGGVSDWHHRNLTMSTSGYPESYEIVGTILNPYTNQECFIVLTGPNHALLDDKHRSMTLISQEGQDVPYLCGTIEGLLVYTRENYDEYDILKSITYSYYYTNSAKERHVAVDEEYTERWHQVNGTIETEYVRRTFLYNAEQQEWHENTGHPNIDEEHDVITDGVYILPNTINFVTYVSPDEVVFADGIQAFKDTRFHIMKERNR